MKAKTFTGQGYVYFVYEDYYGVQYTSYDELRKEMEAGNRGYLIGYHHSYFFNRSEPIDEMKITMSRPRIGAVKQFMQNCKTIVGIEQ